MMRRVSEESTGGGGGVNTALETISAAANAIASAEARAPPSSVPKRRWGGCWSIYWCFGSHKQRKRIGHAVLVPEPVAPRADVPVSGNSNQAPGRTLPFIAPPSSPASFLQSEPSSITQSPAGLLSFTSISANIYSPSERPSIFAIGPYAHETQLVSPPVFSTFTTEPSTAPFTPPPESVHMTTPSSPEVPFAQLLDPKLRNGDVGQRFPLSHYEFQSYQIYPGSPVGHLISPGSGISGSGTSSPFPDRDFAPGSYHLLQFRAGDAPHLLNLDKISIHEWGSRRGSGTATPDPVKVPSYEWGSRRGSGTVTPDPVKVPSYEWGSRRGSGSVTPDAVKLPKYERASRRGSGSATPNSVKLSSHEIDWRRESGTATPDSLGLTVPRRFLQDSHIPGAAGIAQSGNGCGSEMVIDYRVSFELTADDVGRCSEKEPAALLRAVSASLEKKAASIDAGISSEYRDSYQCRQGETSNESIDEHQAGADVESGQQQYQKHRSITLGSAKEFNFGSVDGAISSDLWANEQATGKEDGIPSKNWSFFPMLQPGVG